MIISFTKQADADLDYFKKSGNQQIIKKVKELLEAMAEDPYKGIGQPEALRHTLSGAWQGALPESIGWFTRLKIKQYIFFL